MKRFYTSLAVTAMLTAFLFTAPGCTGKKTIKKSFHMVLELNFDVNDPNNTAYTQAQLLDAAGQNADFSKNKGDLISISLDSTRYYTTYVVDPTGTNSQQIDAGTITVSSENGNENINLASIQNVNLMGIFEEGNAQKLTLQNDGVAKFVSMLTNSPNKAKITLSGNVNTAPTNFKARIKFYVSFNAWVL